MSGRRARAVIAQRAYVMGPPNHGVAFWHSGLRGWGRYTRAARIAWLRRKSRHADVRERERRLRLGEWERVARSDRAQHERNIARRGAQNGGAK